MGKYVLGLIAVLVLLGGTFFLGYTAGISSDGGRVCQMDPQTGQATDKSVCIVDGVRYVPEDSQTDE
ncbi:hypothetical protein BRM1_03630 [Brevibacterium sp. BRM-1]|uniref:hypothetical protein n=1 Tax=Brevibacterium sp. BRM-1 TaxID=2999062 RepID=UPI00227DCABB|nr:hypothetical protein [Brevibacterium sp. BRM-1]WAL40965.1 hypothetical protein BRM1_03630 [Brevibacterium sp. BRM-1]